MVIVSHSDSDHVGGLIGLVSSEVVRIRNVYLNTDSEKGTPTWRSAVRALQDARRRTGLQFHVGISQDTTPFLQRLGFDLEVLAPSGQLAALGPGEHDDSGNKLTTNTLSVVLRVRRKDERYALLAGDVDETGVMHLLDGNDEVTAGVLVYPHHGGKSGQDSRAFAEKLCAAVKPHTVLVSNGRGRYHNPIPEVVEGIRSGAGARVACTQLSTRCAESLPTASAHLLPFHAAGKATRKCCGGTFLVDLSGSAAIQVAPGLAHLRFVEQVAPNALCLGRKPRDITDVSKEE